MAVVASWDLLERERELSTLADAFELVARRRRGQVVLVSGEAGAGKSELLRRFCDEAVRSARLLWAACDPLYTPRPMGPLLDIAATTGGELQQLVAAAAAPHDVAVTVLRDLDAPAPALLVLEDLHWADEATLDVVRLVARRIESVPALLVLSYRDEQVGRGHPLRLLLGELPRAGQTRIEVSPLSPEGVAALAEPVGVDPDELYSRTGGNPFFVTEVLAANTQRMPETVRDAVLARVARLNPATRALLDAVSIVPQPTEMWLVEALTGAAGGLEDCLASGILKAESGCVAYRHELARLAVEESLSPDARIALHRRALSSLSEPPSGRLELARLAHHADAAADAQSVLRHAPAAAEEAAAFGAHREAAEQYARALRFAGGLTPVERAGLLERFAAECYLTDMRQEGIDALREATAIHRAAGDTRGTVRTLLALAAPLGCAGRGREADAAVSEAVQLLSAAGSEEQLAQAYCEQANFLMCEDEHERAIDLGSRAITIAERTGSTDTLIRALNAVGVSEVIAGRQGGVEKVERSMDLARAAGLDAAVGRGYINLVFALGQRRDWQRARPFTEDGIEFARARGLEAWEDCLIGSRALMELASGDFDAAAATARAVLDRAGGWHSSARLEQLCILGLIRARRGDPDVWPALDEAQQIAIADGGMQYLAAVAPARAEARWLEGRPELVEQETAVAFERALAVRQGLLAAELAVWRRRAATAHDLPAGLAQGPFGLELTGAPRAAAEEWRRLGMPYEAALALAGDEDEPALREAHDQLQALGARPAAAIVARRLRERGARNVRRGPNAPTRANAAGLTRRELEVLELLTEGLRNAEISRRLVLSERTVHHHVSAVLRKLGVASRAAAGPAARRMGILEREKK